MTLFGTSAIEPEAVDDSAVEGQPEHARPLVSRLWTRCDAAYLHKGEAELQQWLHGLPAHEWRLRAPCGRVEGKGWLSTACGVGTALPLLRATSQGDYRIRYGMGGQQSSGVLVVCSSLAATRLSTAGTSKT